MAAMWSGLLKRLFYFMCLVVAATWSGLKDALSYKMLWMLCGQNLKRLFYFVCLVMDGYVVRT